jgi:death-on-curing protein
MVETGQAPAPLRDPGALSSALTRSRTAELYTDADLVRQAALVAVGISQAQAFLDGNKRTAFAACDLFLRWNGLEFSGDPLGLARQLEAVAERTDTLEAGDRSLRGMAARKRGAAQP